MEPSYYVFPRREEDALTLITVNSQPVDFSRYPFHVTVNLPYQAQSNGLPAGKELQRVGNLEEKLGEALGSAVIHLGHVTGRGRLRVAFRSRTAAPAELKVKTGFLKTEMIPIHSAHDPEGMIYKREMRPEGHEIELCLNHELLDVLEREGDQSHTPRWVDFSAQFPSCEARAAFVEAVVAEGFIVTDRGLWEDQGRPIEYWCEVKRETSVEADTIGRFTMFLRAEAARHQGEFDGWACPVIR